MDKEEHHAAPSPQTWLAPKVAAHALYTGVVIGAQAAKNGMTKFRHTEALWKPPRLDNEEHRAVPSLRNCVAPKVAAHAWYTGVVIGAQAAKNRRTKTPLRRGALEATPVGQQRTPRRT